MDPAFPVYSSPANVRALNHFSFRINNQSNAVKALAWKVSLTLFWYMILFFINPFTTYMESKSWQPVIS